MDILDPRLFIILPEHHTSNANNLWNCALFLTQLANNEHLACSLVTSLSSNQSLNAPSANGGGESNTNNQNGELSLLNDRDQPTSNAANVDGGINLNEILMRFIQVKRRNKASLFNLLIPSFNLASKEAKLNNFILDNQVKLLNESTPWVLAANGDDDLLNNTNTNVNNTDINSNEPVVESDDVDNSTNPVSSNSNQTNSSNNDSNQANTRNNSHPASGCNSNNSSSSSSENDCDESKETSSKPARSKARVDNFSSEESKTNTSVNCKLQVLSQDGCQR